MELETLLVGRVRSGDREALAEFVRRYEPLIRARFREQFASSPRRLFDSSDFFATVSRRADAAMGKVAPAGHSESPGEMLGRIMRAAASDYARSLQAESLAYRGRVATGVGAEPTHAGEKDERSIVSGLDAIDRQIFRLRAIGAQHGVVGNTLGMTESAVRMRWSRILGRLQRLARQP